MQAILFSNPSQAVILGRPPQRQTLMTARKPNSRGSFIGTRRDAYRRMTGSRSGMKQFVPWQLTVDAAMAQSAVALQQWFACQQMRIIGGSVPQPEITRLGKLCELLHCSPDGEMTLRNFQNSHGFSGNEVCSLITSAPMQLHLQKRQNPAGGRASYLVGLLHPNP